MVDGARFTFKSFMEKIADGFDGDPVAAALDTVTYQGMDGGVQVREDAESFRKCLAALGYEVVSRQDISTRVAEKLRDLALEVEEDR